MRNLHPIKIGDIIRVIPSPEAKMLSYGKLIEYGEDYITIGPLGNNSEGKQIAINEVDPGIDGITSFPMRNAIVTLVSEEFVTSFDEGKFNQLLGQMKQ